MLQTAFNLAAATGQRVRSTVLETLSEAHASLLEALYRDDKPAVASLERKLYELHPRGPELRTIEQELETCPQLRWLLRSSIIAEEIRRNKT